ncbi:hypothetical protein LOTGIDRAFT_172437 [Lottia gigantea]|uniref:Chitin-binding type-2 domain-containing protein n=1 Tax=Lottia gigantea TaxID=225164 RepID=V4B6I7_LOTGI|nr:hypothetical protein LOTGIDRAFT_172437 [Lottia gigantea]ESP01687.1 hypothetical protein LOTGIDRAFT_172437 [Lottia gigantea]
MAVDGTTSGFLQFCSFGTVWDSNNIACVWPSSTIVNPCTNQTSGKMMKYYSHCSAYWYCSGGSATSKCCPPGEKFQEDLGCISDGTSQCEDEFCNDFSTTANLSMPCSLQSSDCPAGTTFDELGCTCQKNSGEYNIREAFFWCGLDVCHAGIDIPFTGNNIEDVSMNRFYVEYDKINVTGGTAIFQNNQSHISIPGTANMPMGTDLYISITFKVGDSVPILQAVLENKRCDGAEEPSTSITVLDSSITGYVDLDVKLLTEGSPGQNNVKFTVPKNIWLETSIRYDGQTVTVSVFKESNLLHQTSWQSTGPVLVRRSPIGFGSLCSDYANFTGSLRQFLLYRCDMV